LALAQYSAVRNQTKCLSVSLSADIPKQIAFFEDFKASPSHPPDNSIIKAEKIVQHWWNHTDMKERDVLGGKCPTGSLSTTNITVDWPWNAEWSPWWDDGN